MRTFFLARDDAPRGAPVTGRVAEGIEFTDGLCCLRWIWPAYDTVLFKNIGQVETAYCRDGVTRIVFRSKFKRAADKKKWGKARP